jgi:methyl-accepting chemotaxis protein
MRSHPRSRCSPGVPRHDRSGQDLANTQAGALRDVAQGLKSGALTQQEGAQLLERQQHISGLIDEARTDGMVSPFERFMIEFHQFVASLEQFCATHNSARGTSTNVQDMLAKQENHLGRIAEGLEKGSLTGAETAHLLGQQAAAARQVAKVQQDGEVTPEERFEVTRGLVRASYDIFRLTGTAGRIVLVTG